MCRREEGEKNEKKKKNEAKTILLGCRSSQLLPFFLLCHVSREIRMKRRRMLLRVYCCRYRADGGVFRVCWCLLFVSPELLFFLCHWRCWAAIILVFIVFDICECLRAVKIDICLSISNVRLLFFSSTFCFRRRFFFTLATASLRRRFSCVFLWVVHTYLYACAVICIGCRRRKTVRTKTSTTDATIPYHQYGLIRMPARTHQRQPCAKAFKMGCQSIYTITNIQLSLESLCIPCATHSYCILYATCGRYSSSTLGSLCAVVWVSICNLVYDCGLQAMYASMLHTPIRCRCVVRVSDQSAYASVRLTQFESFYETNIIA